MNELIWSEKLLGGTMEVVAYTDDQAYTKKILEEMYQEGLRLAKIFNFYDPESELSRLNAQRRLVVSDELYRVIQKALAVARLTDGAYDPALGKLFLQRKKGGLLSPQTCSYRDVVSIKNNVILSHPDVLIDLGSIAKGFIADKLTQFLRYAGIMEFVIDARGDIIISGSYTHVLSVQHPREKGRGIHSLSLINCGVATSGDYAQYVGSFGNSHILHQKECASVTVVAPTLMDADVFSTALFVSDEKTRTFLLKNNTHIKALIIDRSLNSSFFNGMEELLHET